MLQTLRRFLLSLPVLVVAALCALYLAAGFWGLPALVKWQAQKQVREKLGQNLNVADIRFNPLVFQLEVRELLLADDQGQSLLAFQRMWIDFELWRSLVDQTWTFSEAALQAPQLNLTLLKDGRHNFSAMLDKLQSGSTQPQDPSPLPSLAVQHLSISDAQIEVSDQQLAPPLITRIAPLSLVIDGVSTVAKQAARYRLTAPTAQGESLASDGSLSLNPVALQGSLSVKNVQVNTLVRALSRWLAIDAPGGNLAASGRFDLAVKGPNQLTGTVQDISLDLADLTLTAPGGQAPLLAAENIGLAQGNVDIGQQQVRFTQFTLDKGQVNASTNAQGLLDWATLVRPSPDSPADSPADASNGAPWQISIGNSAVSQMAVHFQDATKGQRIKINAVALSASPTAEFGAAALTLQLGPTRLALTGVQLENTGQQLTVPALAVQATHVGVTQSAEVMELSLQAPRIEAPQGLTAQDKANSVSLTNTVLQTDQATLKLDGTATRVALRNTKIALAGATARMDGQSATLAEGSLQNDALTVELAPGQMDVNATQWGGTLSSFKAQRGPDSAALDQLTLKGATVAVQQRTNGPMTVNLKGTAVATRGTALRQGDDTMALGGASLTAGQLSLAQDKGRLQMEGNTAALRLDTLSVRALGASANLGQAAQINLAAQSIRLTVPEGPVELNGAGLSADLSQAVLNSPADASELVRVGRAALAGGAFGLQQRQFTADTLTLAQGEANTWLDAQGQFNLLSLFDKPRPANASPVRARSKAQPAAKPTTAAPWRIAVKQTQVDGFNLNFEDRGVQPPLALRLAPIQAQVKALDTGASAPMQITLRTTLASGGGVQVDGSVHATTGVADLQLSLTDIALAPVQSYLSKYAELQLASGTASSSGRLQYGDPQGAGAQLVFNGKMAVNKLLLEEVDPKRPFLGWSAVGSDEVLLTLSPDRLDITELRVDQPSGRLIIAADQSVNLSDVLKKTDPATPPAPAEIAEPAATEATQAPAFPMSIARVRVADGMLDFSDASLRPQFAARMHELKGVVTGLSNDPDQSAKLQLDARVDQYGSAKIGGQISLLSPEKLTEIDMSFRNLEMTSLSPYVVKFAGYRIAGGRLWLDLKYRVKDGKLLGENKVVLKKVELGEKVESPDALNLPLGLAIAILSDSDGVIDIGLPVSGDLTDPQFDYGAIIGKAIGNLLGSIVTAPFKALAALFGSTEKALDTVVFEPGTATLAPPERQKLAAIARALNERPKLKLVVPPTGSVVFDTAVLKSLAVRRDIVTAMGITLAAGEDPGPVDAVNPRTQKAIDTVFSTRYAPEVLAALKARALSATPPQPSSAFYQGLLSRLLAEQPVSAEALAALAAQRSDAIVSELTQTHGVAVGRTSVGKAEQARTADAQSITLQLQLEVAQ